MIRRKGEYRVDLRENMRGGDGCVKIEHLWEPDAELRSGLRLCARLTVAPGCSIGFHAHENEEEIFVVVRGCGEIDDNGRTATVCAGDTILTGGGHGHAVRCAGGEPLELLAVISPYRTQS